MKILSDKAVGTAHGKLILIGEHSVVYGEPAIALPFLATNVNVTIETIVGESMIHCSYFNGPLNQVPENLNNLKKTIEAICEELNRETDGMNITISSLIPAERGMGSSAAVASALVRALFDFFGTTYDTEDILRFVEISEEIAHGNPSGLDARVVSGMDPLYYLKDSMPESFNLQLSGVLIAADTGLKGQTKEAVSDVAQLLRKSKRKTKKIIRALGSLTNKARIAIEQDDVDILGQILSKTHEYLSELDVSNEMLDSLVQVALKSGAKGAKLTGGGRGGCMIALADTLDQAKVIANELIEAGAVETWVYPLGADIDE